MRRDGSSLPIHAASNAIRQKIEPTDDVLQEVWLRARGSEGRSRAWLGTVLRKTASGNWRYETTRDPVLIGVFGAGNAY